MKSASRLPRVCGSALLAVAGWLLPPGNLEAQVAAPGWTVSVHATDVSTVSGGEALAADLGTGNLLVKSLQDPAGSHVQLAEVTPGGAVTLLATYPALRNADISGVAIDPLTGGIIVADEADVGRIALVNRLTLGVSTLFAVYEIVAQVGPPASKEQCKSGGWKAFNTPRTFTNQGDCIQFFNTGE